MNKFKKRWIKDTYWPKSFDTHINIDCGRNETQWKGLDVWDTARLSALGMLAQLLDLSKGWL